MEFELIPLVVNKPAQPAMSYLNQISICRTCNSKLLPHEETFLARQSPHHRLHLIKRTIYGTGNSVNQS